MDIVRMELGRLGFSAMRMVNSALGTVVSGGEVELAQLETMDDDVDLLHAAIVTYLGRLSQENLSERQAKLLQEYLSAANYIENIGDVIETNMVDLGRQRLTTRLVISPKTREYLNRLNDKVTWAVERSFTALASNDVEMAHEVLDAKQEIWHLADESAEQLSARLGVDAPQSAGRVSTGIGNYRVPEADVLLCEERIAKIVSENDNNMEESESAKVAEQESEAVTA